MTIGILQPGYLPWLGFFEQLHTSDLFVIYDDVTFDKGGWRNRNRVKTSQGICWLTVPVVKKDLIHTLLSDVEINNITPWWKKHLGTLKQSYGKAPYFSDYFPIFEEGYGRRWERLIDLDMFFIEQLMKAFAIERPLHFSSSLSEDGDRNGRLISICRHFGADRFYEGQAGKDYIDIGRFRESGIEVIFQDYQHPEYPQLHGEFIPYLSAVDLLLNMGPESLSVITHRGSARPSLENYQQQI
jgi:hypothetical protein